MVKLKDIFCDSFCASGYYTLTGKFVKTPKESAIFEHVLLDGHKANFHNFSILLKENKNKITIERIFVEIT